MPHPTATLYTTDTMDTDTFFQINGYAITDPLLSAASIRELREEVDRLLAEARERGGFRHGMQRSEKLRALATTPELLAWVSPLLGSHARAVKLTGFDKTPKANWRVPWHQDLTITLKEQHEVPGYGPWTMKDGLPHVQPPAAVLQAIVALRLHLDHTDDDNGALRVLPGSHKHGKLSADQIRQHLAETTPVTCPVRAGAAMLMSPLLLHASSPAKSPQHRRVLHFEYTAIDLPEGLTWA